MNSVERQLTVPNKISAVEQMQVLIVDDSVADSEWLRRLIEDIDPSISISILDGALALNNILQTCHPNLVFIDQHMGADSGTALIEHYRQDFPKIPFILLTGLGGEQVASEALRAGATDYVRKDELNPNTLLRLIRQNRAYWAQEFQIDAQAAAITRQADIINATSDYVTYVDLQGRLQFLNLAAQWKFGLANKSRLSDLHITEFFSKEGVTFIQETLFPALLKGNGWKGELDLLCDGGNYVPMSIVAFVLRDEDGNVESLAFIMRDISREKQREQSLYYAANHDRLTGLVNRSMITEVLQNAVLKAKRAGKALAVLFLDLDHFKGINDTLGHAAGDELLKVVANWMMSTVRDSDSVARIGGDEFVIVMELLDDILRASRLAQRIITLMEKPVTLCGQEVFVTPSIGIATYPECGSTAEVLMQKADMAMYLAKSSGRNAYYYYSNDLQQSAVQYEDIKNRLHRAIQRNEFFMVYQPIVNQDGHVLGWEALVRWQSPDHSVVAPDDFIPVAEQSGLIKELGQWIIKTCLLQLKQLIANRPNTIANKLSINLSVFQLRDPSLVKLLVAETQDQSIAPSQIMLEITESALIDEVRGGRETIVQLAQYGFVIAIDDFGTGYASFRHIQNLPIKVIKIDRSFVSNVDQDKEKAALVDAMLTMARALSLTTIIEGIETPQELTFFAERGCDHFQGYLFSAPKRHDEQLKNKALVNDVR